MLYNLKWRLCDLSLIFWANDAKCQGSVLFFFLFCGADPDTMDVHRLQGIPWHHLPQLEARLQRWTNHVLPASCETDFSYSYFCCYYFLYCFFCVTQGCLVFFLNRQVNWRSITLTSRPLPWLLPDSATILTTEGPTISTRQSKTFVGHFPVTSIDGEEFKTT